jgi:hypothetical protein
VPPEDGQVMSETRRGILSFNKVKVIMKCIKLVRVIKLYRDAGQQNIKCLLASAYHCHYGH